MKIVQIQNICTKYVAQHILSHYECSFNSTNWVYVISFQIWIKNDNSYSKYIGKKFVIIRPNLNEYHYISIKKIGWVLAKYWIIIKDDSVENLSLHSLTYFIFSIITHKSMFRLWWKTYNDSHLKYFRFTKFYNA